MNATLQHGGFSLIEVMVAVLILGVAVAGLTRGMATALDSSKESEEQTVASLFAAGKIEALRAGRALENGETDGDCGDGLAAYRWRQTISDTGVDGLHEVDVVVARTRNHQDVYELKTLLFAPAEEARGKDSSPAEKPGGAT